MPIINQADWDKWVENNQDAYGGACVAVAREVMRLLDDAHHNDFDTHAIICEADANVQAGGLTGFMAGAVASMVAQCHSRGEEFRRKWNLDNQIGDEGARANNGKGVLNPAILTVEDDKT